MYDLMRECWKRNESARPNFREIHLFLQRKNLGYKPEGLQRIGGGASIVDTWYDVQGKLGFVQISAIGELNGNWWTCTDHIVDDA